MVLRARACIVDYIKHGGRRPQTQAHPVCGCDAISAKTVLQNWARIPFAIQGHAFPQGHAKLSTKFHELGCHRGWVIIWFGLVGVGSMRLSTGEWDLWYPFKMGNDTPLIVDILCFEQATEKWTKIKYEYDQSGALSHIIILYLSKYFTANQT